MSSWLDKQGRRHVGVMVNGKRVHRILPQGATAGDAKRIEADIRSAIGAKREVMIPGDPPMTKILELFAEHAKTLRSPETAQYHAARLHPWAKLYRASQAEQCAAHAARDMSKPIEHDDGTVRPAYAQATIARSIAAMTKGLTLAWKARLIPENYGLRVERVKVSNIRTTTLDLAEVQKLADSCSQQVRCAIWIALYTGCRRGEILSLTASDIGQDTLTIRAGNTKTLKTRTIPIIAPLRPWLDSIPLQINAEGLKTGFRRGREKAGMPEVNFHDLRRSCGTLMVQAGVDLYVVSKVLGHSSTAVTQTRYAHLQVDTLRDGLNRAFG